MEDSFSVVIAVDKNYKIRLFIFTLLSIKLFLLTPVSFINKLLAAAICIGVLIHMNKIKFSFKRLHEYLLFVVVNMYLTFAVFGYDLYFTNTLYKENILKLFIIGLAFIWTSYVLQSFLDVICSFCKNINHFSHSSNERYWIKWIILCAIMIFIFMVWQRAYNPISFSPDSWRYLDGWLNNSYNSLRSPVYTFLINIVCNFAPTKPEVAWIAYTQIFVFSSLLTTILMYLHKRWIRFKYIIPIAVILPLIPSFALHTIVIWADLACGIAMLWFTYVLVRILDEMIIYKTATNKQQYSFFVQLAISMVLIYFIRSNSFLVYLVMVPVLIIFFAIKKQLKLLMTVISSIIIVLLVRYPGYAVLDVQPGAIEHARYFAGIHDVQSVYYNDGKLSEQTQHTLRKYLPELDEQDARDMFQPDWVRLGRYGYDYEVMAIKFNEFASMYIDALIHNPFKIAKSVLFRVRPYWVIDPKEEIHLVNFRDLYGYERFSIELNFTFRNRNILTDTMDRYLYIMAMTIPSTFVWRFGVWMALLIISTMALLLYRRYIILLAYLPVFIYFATLLLSCGWTDYRYGLPIFFIALFLPFVSVMLQSENKDEMKDFPCL